MRPSTESLYREKFSSNLNQLFSEAWRICRNNPAQGLFLLKSYQRQKRKAYLRKEVEKRGTAIPPVLIFSMTNQCNLRCKGCYAMSKEASIISGRTGTWDAAFSSWWNMFHKTSRK